MTLKTYFLPTVILITLIVLLINRHKLTPSYNKNFIAYLVVTFFVETTAHLLTVYYGNNIPLYNFQMIFEISFFYYTFYKAISKPSVKQIILYFSIAFLVFAIGNLIFYQTLYDFNSYTYTLGSIFLSFLCLYFLFEIVILSTNIINPFQNFLFWVSIGILFCYLGNLPYLSSLNVLFQNHDSIVTSLSIISKVVNTLLFVLMIIGVLCQKKK